MNVVGRLFRYLFVSSVILLFFVSSIQAVPPEDDDGCEYISDISPADYAEDVVITAKGVQTCITITPPDDCTVNVTFMWGDFESYYEAWLEVSGGRWAGACGRRLHI